MLEIKKEIEYILKHAKEFDVRLVSLNELLLFSTATGDAWILDTNDKLAICLMRNGDKQDYTIIDTPTQFGFEWDYKYLIEDEIFIIINKSGGIRQILGYPVKELAKSKKD
jgi:hypothetical protein